MTTITETWQGRSFPTAYRHALLQIGKGTAVAEIELRKTDAGKYRVTWNVNRGAGW